MPYAIFKTPLGGYGVKNIESGKIYSSNTTKAKAQAQLRLLYSLEKK